MNCSKRVAALNDEFRKNPIDKTGHNKFVFTRGVMALPSEIVACALAAMMHFDDFRPDNDPYGEHDFGSFKVLEHRFFFKFDYSDLSLEYGSEDATDPTQTRRILTLMLS